MARTRSAPAGLEHCRTGIDGLDAITSGGLPRGRTTLVAGSAGCGKTLLATEFLVRGAAMGEAGVLLAFEETADELMTNVASLGWDLQQLCADGMLVVDHMKVEREQIDQTGDYDLEALFIRLGYAIDQIGATRVVLDTLEVRRGAQPRLGDPAPGDRQVDVVHAPPRTLIGTSGIDPGTAAEVVATVDAHAHAGDPA